MNKYEQLIDFIINEQEDKARELFHQIVVEKSRDIYENLIDEEDFEETIGGNQVDTLVDEIEADEQGMQEADDDLEMTAELPGDGMADDEGMDMDSDVDMDADAEMSGDMDMDMDMDAEEGSTEDRISDLESALEELKAEFDALMADEESEEENEPGIHDAGAEDEMDMGAEEGEDEEATEESFVREYVENRGEVYKGKLDPTTEGEPVGATGDRPSINKQSIVAKKNDMGGSASNIAKGGTEGNPDGKAVPTPSNEYTKKRGELPGAGKFENVPGAKTKGYKNRATSYEKAKGKEGQTTDGKMPVDTKSLVGGKVR